MPTAFPTGRAGRLWDSFAHRDFSLLWTTTVTGHVGEWIEAVVQGWLLLELTNSPFYLGLAGFCRVLPTLLFSLPTGALADRLDRRNLMAALYVMAGLLPFGLAALVAWGQVQAWHILLAAFLVGAATSSATLVRHVMIPNVVPPRYLLNAVSLHSVGKSGGGIVGPALAGVLMAQVGAALSFVGQGLSFLLTAALTLAMRSPRRSTEKVAQAQSTTVLLEGLQYVRGDRMARALIILGACPSALGLAYQYFLPSLARDVYGTGPEGLGLLTAAGGVGALAASLIIAPLGNVRLRGGLMVMSEVAFGLLLLALSINQSFALGVVLIALAGGTHAIFAALNNAMLQDVVPDWVRGRVLGVFALTWGLVPISSLISGALAEYLGVPLVIGLGGVATAAAILFFGLRFSLVGPARSSVSSPQRR